MAVVWQPFCAQGIVDGIAQYPTIDHNKSKTVGGLISVLAVNRELHGEEPRRDAAPGRGLPRRPASAPRPTARSGRRSTPRRPGCRSRWPPSRSASRSSTPRLPLESIKRISKFLSDNGVIARDVSGEVAQYYTYEFLSKATGKSPADLGQNQ